MLTQENASKNGSDSQCWEVLGHPPLPRSPAPGSRWTDFPAQVVDGPVAARTGAGCRQLLLTTALKTLVLTLGRARPVLSLGGSPLTLCLSCQLASREPTLLTIDESWKGGTPCLQMLSGH